MEIIFSIDGTRTVSEFMGVPLFLLWYPVGLPSLVSRSQQLKTAYSGNVS